MMLTISTAETSAGYALFKAKDKKLLQHEELSSEIGTAEQICSQLRLKQFQKFDSAAEALEEVSALVESKVTPRLASLLESIKDEKKASLAVADPKLGVYWRHRAALQADKDKARPSTSCRSCPSRRSQTRRPRICTAPSGTICPR